MNNYNSNNLLAWLVNRSRCEKRILKLLLVLSNVYICAVLGSYFIGPLSTLVFYSTHTDYIAQEEMMFRPASFDSNLGLRNMLGANSLPLLGASPRKKSLVCSDEGYGDLFVTTDRLGFRNSDEVWEEYHSTDVVLVGDSMVFGECVGDDYTIAARLNRNGLRTVSLGMGGNSSPIYAAIQKEFVNKIKPRHLITVFYPNDRKEINGDIFYERYFEEGRNSSYLVTDDSGVYLSDNVFRPDAHQDFKKAITEPSFAEKAVFYIEKAVASRHWRLDGFLPWIAAFYPEIDVSIESGTQLAIDTAIQECRTYGCFSSFVYIPPDQVYDRNPLAPAYKRSIERYLQSQEMKLIDATDDLLSIGRRAYSPDGPHLSPDGYQIVAAKILNEIEN